jgi:hypothetical protein
MERQPLIDLREQLKGPGTHALILGISVYPHLPPFGKPVRHQGPVIDPSLGLTSQNIAAESAFRICHWLEANRNRLIPPLATCRLLLAPSEEELKTENSGPAECLKRQRARFGEPPRCDTDSFLAEVNAWREDARRSSKDATFFYFAGNGFEIDAGDTLIALQDFGSGIGPLLRATCRVDEIFKGMAPIAPESSSKDAIARTQLYFIDTDRSPSMPIPPNLRRGITLPLDVPPASYDDRAALLFYATAPGLSAVGFERGPTVFASALELALDRLAAVPRIDARGQVQWQVTIASLADGLPRVVRKAAEIGGFDQEVKLSGLIRDSAIVRLDGPPLVKTRLLLHPPEAAARATVEVLDVVGGSVTRFIRDEDKHAKPGALRPDNETQMLPGGMYRLSIDFPDPGSRQVFADQTLVLQAMPLEPLWNVDVSHR